MQQNRARSDVAGLRTKPGVPLHGRLVVVSPHSDDAVLSLGATLAAHARTGGGVLVVTVLAGDPGSSAPASPWDAAGGFASAAEAATRRAREDVRACRLVGADVAHLSGSDEQYGQPWDEDALWAGLRAALEDADEVLLPGLPLAHDDHRSVTRFVIERLAPDRPVRLYAEEPYFGALRGGGITDDPWHGQVAWSGTPLAARDTATKIVAVMQYWTQVKLLTGARSVLDPRWTRLPGRLWAAARGRGEWISEPVPARTLVAALHAARQDAEQHQDAG